MTPQFTHYIDGKAAIIHCDGDGFQITSPDFQWSLTRGGNWSRNPFNSHRYLTPEAAEAARNKFTKPRFDEQEQSIKFSPRITDETLKQFGFKENRVRADEGELTIYCDHDSGGARSAAIEIDVSGYAGCSHEIRVRPPQTEEDLRQLLWCLNIDVTPNSPGT